MLCGTSTASVVTCFASYSAATTEADILSTERHGGTAVQVRTVPTLCNRARPCTGGGGTVGCWWYLVAQCSGKWYALVMPCPL
uniref:Putative secreted protein n=1 Tax=Ixodes ricinus TaxID=34613 RepID=A0A6B0TX74_IXORI